MKARTRLRVCAILIILSILYGWVVVTQGEELATAIGVGYSAAILTGMVVVNVWKRP